LTKLFEETRNRIEVENTNYRTTQKELENIHEIIMKKRPITDSYNHAQSERLEQMHRENEHIKLNDFQAVKRGTEKIAKAPQYKEEILEVTTMLKSIK
jgi:hypothetical protein